MLTNLSWSRCGQTESCLGAGEAPATVCATPCSTASRHRASASYKHHNCQHRRILLEQGLWCHAGLDPASEAVRRGCGAPDGGAALPGMIFNLNKQISYTPALQAATRSVQAGRMECTMQNLADFLLQPGSAQLSDTDAAALRTFVVFNERRYVTSSAKRAHMPGSAKVHQTPQGSFLDLMRNARDMLALCNVDAPPLGSNREHVDAGCVPAFTWLWNPALGPLWQVVAEKVQGGALAHGAEVDLEVAELCWRDVTVDGSLRVLADHVTGHSEACTAAGGGAAPQQVTVFSDQCARVRLERVCVSNAGIDPAAPDTTFWKQRVHRREACCIELQGRSEFEARDVTLSGDLHLVVPPGQRMMVRCHFCAFLWPRVTLQHLCKRCCVHLQRPVPAPHVQWLGAPLLAIFPHSAGTQVRPSCRRHRREHSSCQPAAVS